MKMVTESRKVTQLSILGNILPLKEVLNYPRAGALVQWLKLPPWKVGDRSLNPTLAFKFQRKKMFLPRSLVKIQYCGEPP